MKKYFNFKIRVFSVNKFFFFYFKQAINFRFFISNNLKNLLFWTGNFLLIFYSFHLFSLKIIGKTF